jgi:signal transduction histidine kinase
VKVIGVDLDITQQVQSSEDIRRLYHSLLLRQEELERMNREIRTFNIVTAHDYKETLQQLYTNLEYIMSREGPNMSEAGKGNIRRAQVAIQRMNLLTDDINNYFNLYETELPIEPVDVNLVMEKVLEKYAPRLEQAGGNIVVTELPTIPTQPSLFAQLIGNLLDNSIRYRKMISPLEINIRYSIADELNAIPGALKDRPYCIISVIDNGIGFKESDSEKIFDLFYRVSPHPKKGSGIGLAVCRKIMQMHNGFITADSELASGSTFNCYFPL